MLISLNVISPETTSSAQGGLPYAQFLTPAISTFCLLNACYVTTGLGIVCFYLLGVAVTTVVPKSDTALPGEFGTMLPLAFISDVFFSSAHAPHWLHDLASAFPVAPVARAMEDAFNPATDARPMPVTVLLTGLGWSVAAAAIMALAFRWEPGPVGRRAG